MSLPTAPTPKWSVAPKILQAFHDEMFAQFVQTENEVLELERCVIAWRFFLQKPDAVDISYVVSLSDDERFSSNPRMPGADLKSISYVVEDGVAVTIPSELEGVDRLKEHLIDNFSEHSLQRILRGATGPVIEVVNIAQHLSFEGSIDDQVDNAIQSRKALEFFEQKVMYAEQLIFAMSLPTIGLTSIRPDFRTTQNHTIKTRCVDLKMHPDVAAVVERMDSADQPEHYREMSARAVQLAYALMPVTAAYYAIRPDYYPPRIVVEDLVGAGNPEYNAFDFSFHMRS